MKIIKIIYKIASVTFLMGLFTVSLQLSADIKQSIEKMLKQRIALLDGQLHKTEITAEQKTALEKELKKFQDELARVEKLGSEYIKPKTVTITNNSTQPINVVFYAQGCADIKLGFNYVCKGSEQVKPRGSTTYTWKWGQTLRSVAITEGKHSFSLEGSKTIQGKYSWQGYRTNESAVPDKYTPGTAEHRNVSHIESVNPEFRFFIK